MRYKVSSELGYQWKREGGALLATRFIWPGGVV